MGGRGRGRGRGISMSFNVEQLGFGRGGEALPQAAVAPPAVFPPLSTKPLPLTADVQHDYMLVIRRELAHFWRDSPCYVTPPPARGSIERYSDRYQDASEAGRRADRHPHLHRIPTELKLATPAARKRPKAAAATDKLGKRVKWAKGSGATENSVDDKLEKLEKREKMGAGEEEKEKNGVVDSDEEEVDVEDVELDEGTDYANDYFDNGEEYLDLEEDALEEGPIF